MLNRTILALFAILYCSGLSAQDKIVTVTNDTIHCKITRIGQKSVRFSVLQDAATSMGIINLSQVRTLIIDSVSAESESKNGEQGTLLPDNSAESHPWVNLDAAPKRLRLGFSAGSGYLTGSTSEAEVKLKQYGMQQDEIDGYYQQYKLGWQASATIHYFFLPGFAPGLNYRFFATNVNQWATIDPQDNVNIYHGYLVERLHSHYAGVSILASHPLSANKKLMLTSSFSAGMAFYRDETSLLSLDMVATGNAFATTLDAGLEYFIFSHVSLGTQMSLFVSKLKKIAVSNGYNKTTVELDGDEQENMSALDFAGSIRFYF